MLLKGDNTNIYNTTSGNCNLQLPPCISFKGKKLPAATDMKKIK